jgi:hypothetical protein
MENKMSVTRAERRRSERTKIKNPEKFQMEFELLQPWSTFVMKTQLPPPILESMIKITDKILEDKEPAIRFGDKLAGQIEDEFFIAPNILKREGMIPFFLDMCKNYIINAYFQQHKEDQEMILKTEWSPKLTSMWIVSQKDNEYNPNHTHADADSVEMAAISGVMYLKIPEYLPPIKPPNKKNRPVVDGAIAFSNNTSQDSIWAAPSITILPEVGDFFIFPSTQLHQVYPFRTPDGKGERRSVSFNADFTKYVDDTYIENEEIKKEGNRYI